MSDPLTDEELDEMEERFDIGPRPAYLWSEDAHRLLAEVRRLRQLEAGTERLLADVRGALVRGKEADEETR